MLRCISAVPPPLVGPAGTGCINNGSPYSDYGQIGSNNFLNLYETGPTATARQPLLNSSYLSEAGFPSAAWMAEGLPDGPAAGENSDSE